MKRWFGIDIGGTGIKLGMFDKSGNLLRSWTVPTDLTDAGRHIIPQAAEQIRTCLEAEGLPQEAAAGIGLGVPGPVDAAGHVERCVNLNWADVNPALEMQRFFPGSLIETGNDANVAALGEYFRGGGAGTASMIMITLGTGVGAGIVLNGKIVAGAHGLGGEIGHISLRPGETLACSCGNHGCVNQYATVSGIERCAAALLQRTAAASRLRTGAEITARFVCDCAKEGDTLALRCIDECMEPLGAVMRLCSHIFDPEVFVIGGGLSNAGEVILSSIRKHYQEGFYLTQAVADIVPAGLGSEAGIYGACMLVLKAHTDTGPVREQRTAVPSKAGNTI